MFLPIIFSTLLAAFFILISYATTRTYANGFEFTGIATRLTFLTFLLIPLMFMSSLLSRKITMLGTGPKTYTVIQIITGIGFYISIGAMPLGAMLGIAALMHTTLPLWVSFGMLGISVAAALVGFIQAKRISITRYHVALAHAPASWHGKTAALVTDTHFGLVNHEKFSHNIVAKIQSLAVDFVLHGGDFYDGPNVPLAPITESWKALTATTPVFYAPGNHETYGNYAAFIESIRAAGITILDNKKVTHDGVTIAGITYHDGKDNPKAAEALAALLPNHAKGAGAAQDAHHAIVNKQDTRAPHMPTILINHPPTALAAASQHGVDLMVSGHTHNGQFWPATYIVRWIYKQYGYGLHACGHMRVITSKGVGTFGPPMRLGNAPEIVHITFSATQKKG